MACRAGLRGRCGGFDGLYIEFLVASELAIEFASGHAVNTICHSRLSMVRDDLASRSAVARRASGWILWALYAVLALPFLLVVLRYAWSDDRPLADVVAVSLLATFFVAPTARPYGSTDPFDSTPRPRREAPVRLRRRPVAPSGFMVVPYVQVLMMSVSQHVWFFWIPSLLALVWFASVGVISCPCRRLVE